jgi:uncharacterized protein YjbI with pentapeptide repeats
VLRRVILPPVGKRDWVDEQQQPRWRPSGWQLLWAGAALAPLTIAILIGYRYGITLWDWLSILTVPITIGAAVPWLNWLQKRRELDIEKERAQDEALQAYLDRMSDLLIPTKERPSLYGSNPPDHFRWSRSRDLERGLLEEDPPDSLWILARARTQTVLPRLDGDRKARVALFLYESRLIDKLLLRGADLRGANLREAGLTMADLRGTDLSGADLSGARLINADLRQANLRDSDFRGAALYGVDVLEPGAKLSEADLSGADLAGAYLNNADLENASGITAEELDQQSAELDGATMPNGQKYEDWLKDREGNQDDGENGGAS